MNFDEATLLATRIVGEDGEWQYQGLDELADGTWVVIVYSKPRAEYRTLASVAGWRMLPEAQYVAQALA